MHPVQSIGYAAAYPAYPLNPPLVTTKEVNVRFVISLLALHSEQALYDVSLEFWGRSSRITK